VPSNPERIEDANVAAGRKDLVSQVEAATSSPNESVPHSPRTHRVRLSATADGSSSGFGNLAASSL
jgi:hypothetical protein